MVYPFVFFPVIALLGILGFVLTIGSFIFWVFMLVDVIQRKFKDSSEKIIWVLVIIFVHIVGAILYYVFVKRRYKS